MQQERQRPLILISNDDGYKARGINSLINMLRDMGDLLVCAPEGPRSGRSCAFSVLTYITLTKRIEEKGLTVYSCNGTPVDCVKLALDQFCKERKPDIIIGGINHGDNASVNSHYSGTVAIALEGCMKYIPSVAFSLCDYSEGADFEPMRDVVRKVTADVLAHRLPKGVCLNVNAPLLPTFKGVKVCRMAYGTWGNEVVTQRHPRGFDMHWLTGDYTNDEPEAQDTDNWAINNGYVAITPTTIDVTAHEAMAEMKLRIEN